MLLAAYSVPKMADACLWSNDDMKRIIECFRKAEVLWKVNPADYGKRGPRNGEMYVKLQAVCWKMCVFK
jgi:hypothetical protein